MLTVRCRLLALAFCLFISSLTSGQGLPNSPPEEVGLSSERLRRINAVMQSYIADRELAGLVTLVARHGKIAHLEKFGLMEIEKGKEERLAAIYGLDGNHRLQLIEKPADSRLFVGKGQKHFLSGNGGLVSTPSDYARFCQTLLNKGELDGVRILGRKTVEFMTRNHLSGYALESFAEVLGEGVGFGLSFWVVNDAAQTRLLQSEGAYGWAGGASTYFWIDPKEEMFGILMAQFIPFTQYPIARQFRVLAYQAIID